MWLLGLAPLELAATLVKLAARPPAEPGGLAMAIIALRVLVAATGLVLGRQIAQRVNGTRRFACAWAALDLVTLAVTIATDAVPTSRMPGDAPVVWLAYAVAATLVIAAAD